MKQTSFTSLLLKHTCTLIGKLDIVEGKVDDALIWVDCDHAGRNGARLGRIQRLAPLDMRAAAWGGRQAAEEAVTDEAAVQQVQRAIAGEAVEASAALVRG